MGQSHSQDQGEHKEIPIEQLSHELALRFAAKCYSHLEVAHFKDNFKTLADHQDDVEYWKEETLCRFLSIPDALYAGPVLYQMITYLGAFPFPQLAPCIVTREAMVKVVTILTGRFKKVLKRGEHDKNKLIFRSMAIFDRRASSALSPTAKEQDGGLSQKDADLKEVRSHASGYAVDQPINDDEDEDDDDLALAALESLDAIEVFKQDHRSERKINRAHIPRDNLHRLLTLVLALGSLTPQDNIGALLQDGSDQQRQRLNRAADAIIAAFDPIVETGSITYSNFVRTMTMVTPQLFRPLNPLFEHFLFSKQMNLNKHKEAQQAQITAPSNLRSPIYRSSSSSTQSSILDDVMLSQLSCSFDIATPSSLAASGFFHCGAQLNELYTIASDGTSMSSFSRQVTSWRTASLLILSGSNRKSGETHVIGAYLPDLWKDRSSITQEKDMPASKAVMFQLRPRHAIFKANPSNRSTPVSYFSSKTGIALGCIIPSQSVLQSVSHTPVLGPVSLLIDEDFSTATFQHDGSAGAGAFLTDPRLEERQASDPANAQPEKIEIDVDGLEIWGISFSEGTGEDEVTKQQKRLAWEEAEAARRRGVNFGGDKDGARALLEMAGLVGDEAGNRSGGSV